MKMTILTSFLLAGLWLSSCGGTIDNNDASSEVSPVNTLTSEESPATTEKTSGGKPIYLTKAEFLTRVYNYEKNPNEWVYAGDKPCIIDFYADWCKPCKIIAPILSELAQKYDGKLVVYKINTDVERELAQAFGIRSIPTILFCPVNGQPQVTQGALPKESFEKMVNEVLLVN